MADEWAARQNGVPENRIVRFMAAVGGYLCDLRFSLSSLLDAGSSPFRIPFADGAVKPFPGYSYPPGVAPQLAANSVITSGTRTSDAKPGYFRNGGFNAYAFEDGAQIGAFEHSYEDGEPAKRILRIDSAGKIYDAQSGDELARSGSFFASPDHLTYTVSEDGRLLVAESDTTTGPVRNVRQAAIDWPSDSVAWSAIAEATPYGTTSTQTVVNDVPSGTTDHWTFSGSHALNITRLAVYPMTYGLSAAPALQSITAEESFLSEQLTTDVSSYEDPVGERTYTLTFDSTSRVTLTLPDATSAEFEIGDSRSFSTTEEQSSSGGSSVSGADSTAGLSAALGIIYADATVPILFYEHRKTEYSYTSAFSGSSFPVGHPVSDGAVTFTREVGVLANGAKRVLFTESRAQSGIEATSESVVVQQGGFISAAVEFASSLAPTWTAAPPAAASGDSTVDTDITVNKFFKKLKWVTDPDGVGFVTPLNGAKLWLKDVANQSGAFANDHRYFVAVRDKVRWMLGVQRVRDMSGATINELELHAGGEWEDGAMRSRYIDYLIAQAQAAAVPDEDLIATLQGGGFGDYDAALSLQSRIPLA